MTSVIASPSVRALAARNGIDLNELAIRLGRETLTREDVEGIGASRPGSPSAYWAVDHAAYGPVTEHKLTRLELASAKNLSAAQALIPAVTHHDEADAGPVEEFRNSARAEWEDRGIKLTALTFHIAALTRCLMKFPRFNSSLSPDGETLTLKQYCHIGIAVDTELGLVVPVVRNTDQKGLIEIAQEVADLASRARDRKLRQSELGGASMSITNLGGIGGTGFSPLVNPPEVAILGISRMQTRPVWDGNAFQPARLVPLHLSYDHRVINGADAARFLAHYSKLYSEPRRLLL